MPRDRRLCAASVLVLAGLPFVAAPASPQGRPRFVAVRALGAGDASIVEAARQGAMTRLRTPECRQLLSDFSDGKGRSLEENLAAFALPPDEFLAILPLLDGSERPLCQANQSQLLTTAGVPRVFVCKSFLKAVYQQRTMAEVYLIHELLHTLGLGENPPSSQEITRTVVRRCAP
jgi:hypothetical protein